MLTHTPLYLAMGLPLVTVLANLVINLFMISGVRADIRELRAGRKLLTGKVYEMMGHHP